MPSFLEVICELLTLNLQFNLLRTVTDLGFSTADIASPPIHQSVSQSLVQSAPLPVTRAPASLGQLLVLIDNHLICLHVRRAERSFRLRLGFIVGGEREGGHNSDPALSDCGHT